VVTESCELGISEVGEAQGAQTLRGGAESQSQRVCKLGSIVGCMSMNFSTLVYSSLAMSWFAMNSVIVYT